MTRSALRIGTISVVITGDVPRLHRHVHACYGECLVEESQLDRPIHVHVQRQPFSWRHRRRYEVTVNGRLRFEPVAISSLIPYVEWAMNWEVPPTWPEFLHLHASSLAYGNKGIIMAGHSGSGKSTLTTGLVARGMTYLCDEFAMLHARHLTMHTYPRAICLKEPSFAAVEAIGVRVPRARYWKAMKGKVAFLPPCEVRTADITCQQPGASSYPVTMVVFPTYQAGATPALHEISRAQAAFQLHAYGFNLFGCQRPGIDVLTNVVRHARCFHLIAGDLAATCALVEATVQQIEEPPVADSTLRATANARCA